MPKGGGIFFVLQIHKDLLLFDDGIKERLNFICKYANKEVTFYNRNIITLNGTNLHYVEPHRFIINNNDYLIFEEFNHAFINVYENKILFKDLEEYIKNNV